MIVRVQLLKTKNKSNNEVQKEELNNKLRNLDDETREAYEKLYGKKLDSEDSEKEKDSKKKHKYIKKNGKKIKKKKQTPQQKTIAEVLSIVDEYNSDVFVTRNNQYMDFVGINCKDLENATDDEVLYDLINLTKFNKSYDMCYKIIGINFPTNTKSQQLFYKNLIARTHDAELREIQVEKYNELIDIEKNNTDREYYFMIWGETYEDVLTNRGLILRTLKTSKLSRELSFAEKLQLVFKLSNKCAVSYSSEEFNHYVRENDADEQVEMLGYNPYLLSLVGVQGGVSFKDDAIVRIGNGYEECIRIFAYPSEVDRHWLTYIMNIRNAVTSLDVRNLDSHEVKKEINKSISEYGSREKQAKNYTDYSDAHQRKGELKQLYEQVSSQGEVLKEIVARIYISAKSREELDEQVKKVSEYLEKEEYKNTVNLNENKLEWQSLFLNLDEQDKLNNKRKAFPIPSSVLAGGDPYHFTSLNDPYGSYYGTTTTVGASGKVIFDNFFVDALRTSYNGCIFGRMGFGKSTLLKKLFRDRAGRGDYIRVIDCVGEFEELAFNCGGKVISLDGTDGTINFLQIMKLAETESNSVKQHLSKVNTMYHFLNPESSEAERTEFENILTELYINKKILPADNNLYNQYNITNRPNEDYPILSDLLDLIHNKLKSIENIGNKLNEEKVKYLVEIERTINNLVTNYGSIFDCHTTMTNLVDEQIVVYKIKELSSMKQQIFDAQLFSALSTCWSNAVKVGTPTKKLVEEGVIDKRDATHFLLFLDESHNTINATKPFAVQQVLKYAREGRKYFAGIYLASQNIRDFVPEGTSIIQLQQIKELFELCQYKFILNQDNNAIETIKNVLGNLSDSEISIVPQLQKGQAILCVSNEKKVIFNIKVTPDELRMFKGGV